MKFKSGKNKIDKSNNWSLSYLFMPFLYYINIRIKDLTHSNSKIQNLWRFIIDALYWYLPILLTLILFSNLTDYSFYFMSICINFVVLITIYEAGYIFNDFISISLEDKPSIRIPKHISLHIVYLAIFLRIFFGSVLLWVFYILIFSQSLVFICSLAMIVLLIVMFTAHNLIQKKYRFITLFFLRITKLLFPFFNMWMILSSDMIFVLCFYIGLVSFLFSLELYFKIYSSKIHKIYNFFMFPIVSLAMCALAIFSRRWWLYIPIVSYYIVVWLVKIMRVDKSLR